MAGIGFELKKLFREDGKKSNIGGYLISTVVTAGPTVICILLILFSKYYLELQGELYKNIEIFTSAIVYDYALSLVLTGGVTLLLSRYVSDCFYKDDFKLVIPSLFGGIIIVQAITIIISIFYYNYSPLDSIIKILAIVILMELNVIWLQCIYITGVKDYFGILYAFLIGVLGVFVTVVLLNMFANISPVISVMIGISVGFFIMIVWLLYKLIRYYGLEDFTSRDIFHFITSIDKNYKLILIGTFYFIGIFIHNVVFWFSDEGTIIGETYHIAEFYDVPIFYAMLTIIASSVLFVVKVETSFYGKFKEFYGLVRKHGSIVEIENSKETMIHTLFTELRFIMVAQFIITFLSITIGISLLPRIGASMLMVDIFTIVALAAYCQINMFNIMLIMLYFDDMNGATLVSIVFVVGVALFTWISLKFGESFYGYGFFTGATIALLVAFIRLVYYLKNIDYYVFLRQPIYARKNKGIFVKLYNLLYRAK